MKSRSPQSRSSQSLTEDRIIYEDNHLIVVSKPAGVATMGAAIGQPTVLDWTKERIRKKYNKPGNVFLGVVSRIDSFVSGVLVFAKTSKAAGRLAKQFRESSPKKKYLAIVEGTLTESRGVFQTWLRKNDRLKKMESFSREVPQSRFSELDYCVLKQNKRFSLVEVNLITGRKHQIRVQFADHGTPVYADRKYGGSQKMNVGIALHSWYLELQHPTRSERLELFCPLPREWYDHQGFATLLDGVDLMA